LSAKQAQVVHWGHALNGVSTLGSMPAGAGLEASGLAGSRPKSML
jgi:hypothetical protein